MNIIRKKPRKKISEKKLSGKIKKKVINNLIFWVNIETGTKKHKESNKTNAQLTLFHKIKSNILKKLLKNLVKKELKKKIKKEINQKIH